MSRGANAYLRAPVARGDRRLFPILQDSFFLRGSARERRRGGGRRRGLRHIYKVLGIYTPMSTWNDDVVCCHDTKTVILMVVAYMLSMVINVLVKTLNTCLPPSTVDISSEHVCIAPNARCGR